MGNSSVRAVSLLYLWICSMAARGGGGKNATDPALKQNNKTAGATPKLHNIPDRQAASFHRWNGRTRREHVWCQR